jgi:leucyl-tRNA---protein transferase
MEMAIHQAEYGPCPYREGRAWRVLEFAARSFEPGLYERLLPEGWRRSGRTFYRTSCPGCDLCVPLRLDVAAFSATKSQRRVDRANADLAVSLADPAFSQERYDLYRRYVRSQHGADEAPEPLARAAYAAFLLENPLPGAAVSEYRERGSGRLVATGYLDLLPEGISSVYFAFEPSEGRRSLGTWSVLRELALAAELGKRHYYLGFWIPGSPKMDYKANFRPFEFARGGRWIRAADRLEALEALEAADSAEAVLA